MFKLQFALLFAAVAFSNSVFSDSLKSKCPSNLDVHHMRAALNGKYGQLRDQAALSSEMIKAERCRADGIGYAPDEWVRFTNVMQGEFGGRVLPPMPKPK